MNQSWSASGNAYYPVETTALEQTIPQGVYKICSHPQRGFWLEKMADAFTFSHKIYGTERAFIDHVKRTYAGTNGNLGLLANGVQGAGKSVTCKLLANELALPIILLEANQGKGMVDFISSIPQDVLLFADEYEKVFKGEKEDDYNSAEEDSTLLTLMDGVRKTGHRKVFLLTTNKVRLHEAMLQRPGRLRYVKEFGNLSKQVIEEIVDDMLLWPELRGETVAFISKLELISVDVVTSIVSEVNIHRVDPETFAGFFNVKKLTPKYDIVAELPSGITFTLAYSQSENFTTQFYYPGDSFSTRSMRWGEIELYDAEEVMLRIKVSENAKAKYQELASAETMDIRFEAVQQLHASYAAQNAF